MPPRTTFSSTARSTSNSAARRASAWPSIISATTTDPRISARRWCRAPWRASRPTSSTDSRGWVLDKSLRETNYDVEGGITDIHTTWVRSKLDWELSSSWRLANDVYFYDKQGEWKNAEVYTFTPATGLMARSTVGINHDHKFYGDRLTLSNDVKLGSRRNRFTAGIEGNYNDFFSPRRFGNTTSVDPFAPARGTFPADTEANFPGAGNRTDFDSTIGLFSVFAEDAFFGGAAAHAGGRHSPRSCRHRSRHLRPEHRRDDELCKDVRPELVPRRRGGGRAAPDATVRPVHQRRRRRSRRCC